MKHVHDMIRKCSRDTDKIYLYVKDPYEAKHQFLINNREDDGIRDLNDPKGFIEYSNDIQNVYKYNLGEEKKALIVFDDMIADIIRN